MKLINRIIYFFLVIIILSGCSEEWLDLQPLSTLSEAAFWQDESDAYMGLVGLYNWSQHGNGIDYQHGAYVHNTIDDCCIHKGGAENIYNYLSPVSTFFILARWQRAYRAINRCNVFLEKIGEIDMNPGKKAEFIAEARFIRANQYFWLSQFWGGVPLITSVLSIPEANSIARSSKQELVDFLLTEFTEVASDLPASRPASEGRRFIKAAPLTLKGRLLMSEKRWSEAATTFEQIMDLGVHIIDDRFRELFQEAGEDSKEIIYSQERVAGIAGQNHSQRWLTSEVIGGYSVWNFFQSTVDAFPMTDGLSIEESPLYDPDNPFENRDPRLYYSILLPNYTVWEGELFDPTDHPMGIIRGAGRTGYGCIKFTKEYYEGDVASSGADRIYIRYAEVLLGYLESKLEAGDNITQNLLDETINEVRGRGSVNIGHVTETNPDLLREIVRNERRIELLNEPWIRLWDLYRWRIAHEVLRGDEYGMKLTDDPATYTRFPVDENGHRFIIDKKEFQEYHYLWPIPQVEMDINENMVQNPEY